jgi:hypothetical protein
LYYIVIRVLSSLIAVGVWAAVGLASLCALSVATWARKQPQGESADTPHAKDDVKARGAATKKGKEPGSEASNRRSARNGSGAEKRMAGVTRLSSNTC